MTWHPHVTVASIVEQGGRFLVVEEETAAGLRINQPAGHVEPNESIVAGAIREAMEESAYVVQPDAVVGIYRWSPPARDLVYLRFALSAMVVRHEPMRPLDTGILRVLWLTQDELRACADRHRSPLVMRCVDDYVAGIRYPLELLVHYD